MRAMISTAIKFSALTPTGQFEKPQGFAVCLSYENPADVDRVFKTLSQDGKIQMPIQETFFAQRFGMAVDQFGTPGCSLQ